VQASNEEKDWKGEIMIDSRVITAKADRRRNFATLSRHSASRRRHPSSAAAQESSPIIEVSELDGRFHVSADFRMVPDANNVTVEFAQQGVIISGGTMQRYIPIPTDGDIELATVNVADGVARVTVPVAGLGHRWRAIVMW
jgi:hypothetical protein